MRVLTLYSKHWKPDNSVDGCIGFSKSILPQATETLSPHPTFPCIIFCLPSKNVLSVIYLPHSQIIPRPAGLRLICPPHDHYTSPRLPSYIRLTCICVSQIVQENLMVWFGDSTIAARSLTLR